MSQVDSKMDPLVEVLRLAYRRGLAIRQEQSQGQLIKEQQDDGEIQVPESKNVTNEQQPKQTGSAQ